VAHYEDRPVEATIKKEKEIALSDPNHPRVQCPPTGGFLGMEIILDNHLGCTMNGGQYGEVDGGDLPPILQTPQEGGE
jgi:hypothetical protein